MERYLPADLDSLIVGFIPFGALNSCARTCWVWADLASRLDLSKFVETIEGDDFIMFTQGNPGQEQLVAQDNKLTIRQFPNGMRHGSSTVVDKSGIIGGNYELGRPLTWYHKYSRCMSRGRVGGNVCISHNCGNLPYPLGEISVYAYYADGHIVIRTVRVIKVFIELIRYADPGIAKTLNTDIDPYGGDPDDALAIDRWTCETIKTVFDGHAGLADFVSKPVRYVPARSSSVVKKYFPEMLTYVPLDK